MLNCSMKALTHKIKYFPIELYSKIHTLARTHTHTHTHTHACTNETTTGIPGRQQVCRVTHTEQSMAYATNTYVCHSLFFDYETMFL